MQTGMTLTGEHTCRVHIRNKRSTERVDCIRSEKLSITNKEKDLGVWFDTGLKFSSYRPIRPSHAVAKK